MNKQELVQKIAESHGIAKTQANEVVSTMVDTIAGELASGGEVTIPGFGKFYAKEREARTGRNPQTGATIQIAASKTPAFKPGKSLKDTVNGS